MAKSQNGWTVDRTGSMQDRTPVDGVTVPNGVRKGDVATVLHHLMGRFHREVERLIPGTCWGWFVKKIEGSSAISNHASGTAVDLNATRHPMGVRNTFTKGQQTRIREILDDLDGVVRWGGDYTGRPDDMHFEIDETAAAITAVADRIRGETMLTEADLRRIWKTDGIIAAPANAASVADNPHWAPASFLTDLAQMARANNLLLAQLVAKLDALVDAQAAGTSTVVTTVEQP
jgi:hypothetical protein